MPRTNPLEITHSFGDVNIGNHEGPFSIDLQFGDLNADELPNAKSLEIQFSDVQIGSAAIEDLEIQFSSIEIDALTGAFEGHFSFCGKSNLSFDAQTKDVNIKSSHSTLAISLAKSYSADFDISTSFGKLNNSIGLKDMTKKSKYGPNFDHEYEGRTGSGTYRFQVNSSFGKIDID